MLRTTFRSIATVLVTLAALAVPALAQDDGSFESSLRAGDVLRISVWPDAELSGEFPVEVDGQVYLPFLGAVRAIGVSGDELRRQIREGFQSAQRNAVVTVTPLYRIGVTGAVRSPSLYLVPPTDGFFDVIALAGGFTDNAKEDQVSVVRSGQVIKLNAADAIKSGDTLPLEALSLQSGDQLVVPFGAPPWTARDWMSLGNFLISLVLLVDRLQN